ncbi:GyrI-like domain-containing protein [Labilibacter sediminis]|nr:GyrI-like domain-containing protein [Labilibacter sediminis]
MHLQNSETPTTGEFEVFVGYEIADVETVSFELCVKVLPPTDYALFTLRGDQMMGEEPIVDQWLATNPYEIAHTYFVQRYDDRFKGLDRVEESVLDFLVPVTLIEPQTDAPD